MRYPELPKSRQALEDQMLERWREEQLFQQTLDATADGEPWIFYEGPPTANGRPGLHHVIARTIKDIFCRHRTMQGRQVTRIAGWDTHGLPVEIEAEKKLGISGKPEIEAYGIAEFNKACRESVFTYKEEWEAFSERIGYWLDYSRPYVTFHPEYIESVWWILKTLADRGLMYRGHKSVPYCPRCGTPLSSHEVAQGYKDIEDASLHFLCPWLTGEGEPDPEGRAFLVWTTTPWTVPANTGLAVHPDLSYVEVAWEGRTLVLAADCVESVLGEGAEILGSYRGSELAGRRYARPLDLVPTPSDPLNGWTVINEDFVSATDGTGIVHMAPAFGSDDYAAGRKHGLPLLNPLDDAGRFVDEIEVVGGLFVKDADPLLAELLEERGNLFRYGRHVHSYPHCWRCESPLLYVARRSWFAATSTLKEEMLEINAATHWFPPEMGEGRMGEWLRGNVDWALSRERYWGTPIPAWVCDRQDEHVEWIGSFEELAARAGALPDEFDPHRPFIDEHSWGCAECDGTMRRTPEVVDVWFDSGSMPYAQWHYPFENEEEFERHYPADFICEGVDQTRGWFYALMAISAMLGRGQSFRNVLVNDMILDAQGQKMSKSKGNMVDPRDAIEAHGADAVRWYLTISSAPWLPKRYDSEAVAESARKFFDTMFNTYRFFALYANVEDWSPDAGPGEPSLLDRWLLSRLHSVAVEVGRELDGYQITKPYRALGDFVVEDLSNWYVRRSRARFWGNSDGEDAKAAFATLWEALRVLTLLTAPVTPFVADGMHRALTGRSVHLEPFVQADESAIDEVLEAEMKAVRALVSLGRAAREEVQIRVRQPLRRVHAVIPDDLQVRDEVLELLKDELNVKEVEFLASAEGLVSLVAKPDYRALGARFKKATEQAASAIRALSTETLQRFAAGERITIDVEGRERALEPDDLDVVEEPRGDLVVKSESGYTAALDPTLDDELRREGLARELVNRIQRLRKDSGLEITDRIRLGIFGENGVVEAARSHEQFIRRETLALGLATEGAPSDFDTTLEVELNGMGATLALSRASDP